MRKWEDNYRGKPYFLNNLNILNNGINLKLSLFLYIYIYVYISL